MSSKGVVLSQKRIFHNKQFLQKGFSTCICHLNVSSCCAFQTVKRITTTITVQQEYHTGISIKNGSKYVTNSVSMEQRRFY